MNCCRTLLILGIGLGCVSEYQNPALAADTVAAVEGSERTVRLRRADSVLLVHVDDAAKAFGWTAKIVKPGKLLTLCREGKGGLCVPLLLEKLKTAKDGDALFVEATAVARALRLSIEDRGGKVSLRRARKTGTVEDGLPAYNAAWGPGRGFRVGQTVPDIPLVDLDGGEVRFSRFLGKQYILYCWASW